MEGDRSSFFWKLYDPNGNTAGQGGRSGETLAKIEDTIETQNRPPQHSMPFNVSIFVNDPADVDKTRSKLTIMKVVKGCPHPVGTACRPALTTEDKTEINMFFVESCFNYCKDGATPVLFPKDLWCNDLNDAMWEHHGAGYQREYYCGWKGF